jgi:hypothetical protein
MKPVEQFFKPPDKVEEVNSYDESKPDEKKKLDYLKKKFFSIFFSYAKSK